MVAKTITLRREGSDVYLVDDWVPELLVDKGILEKLPREVYGGFQIDGEYLNIRLSNGSARYRRIGELNEWVDRYELLNGQKSYDSPH